MDRSAHQFPHRGIEWADRVAADRAVAYRVHYDVTRERWYLTASWHHAPTTTVALDAALARWCDRCGRQAP